MYPQFAEKAEKDGNHDSGEEKDPGNYEGQHRKEVLACSQQGLGARQVKKSDSFADLSRSGLWAGR